MKNLIHDRTVVYNVGYHIVWSVKYRRSVLCGEIAKSLKHILLEICSEKGFVMKELEIITVTECQKCDFKNIRKFVKGDFVMKEADDCPKCKKPILITAIYQKPEAKKSCQNLW